MKATEIKIENEGYNYSCSTYPSGSHVGLLITLGRLFPSTSSQAKRVVALDGRMDVLNADDVELVEALLNRHGFEGEYKRTKSGSWVRLQNRGDYCKALILEYKLQKK